MKNINLVTLLIAIALALSGCASTPLAPDRIESLSLDPHVAAPEIAYYHGGASNLKEGYGLMGELIATADNDDSARLTAFLRQEHIDFPSIFLTQFSAKLKSSTLGPKLHEAGSLKMKLKIEGFGLGKGWGMSNNMRPSATVRAEILDGQNLVIWKGEAIVGGVTTELPIHTLEEWVKVPDQLRAAYMQAADILASQLLKDY